MRDELAPRAPSGRVACVRCYARLPRRRRAPLAGRHRQGAAAARLCAEPRLAKACARRCPGTWRASVRAGVHPARAAVERVSDGRRARSTGKHVAAHGRWLQRAVPIAACLAWATSLPAPRSRRCSRPRRPACRLLPRPCRPPPRPRPPARRLRPATRAGAARPALRAGRRRCAWRLTRRSRRRRLRRRPRLRARRRRAEGPDARGRALLRGRATGDADALFNLGWMYANGRGIARDDELAALLFARAAAAGPRAGAEGAAAFRRAGRRAARLPARCAGTAARPAVRHVRDGSSFVAATCRAQEGRATWCARSRRHTASSRGSRWRSSRSSRTSIRTRARRRTRAG